MPTEKPPHIDMDAEEKLKSKTLYKIVLYLIKTIPIITSGLFVLNTVLSYLGIDLQILAHICGISVFSLALFYLTSIAFRFCIYHRMFIHYLTVNWILDLYDYYIGIPLTTRDLFVVYLAITGIFLFIILYEYCKRKSIKAFKGNSK